MRITRGSVTREQKVRVVAEISRTLQDVLDKRPEHTHIVIDEIDLDNGGFAGMLTPEYLLSTSTTPTPADPPMDAQRAIGRSSMSS